MHNIIYLKPNKVMQTQPFEIQDTFGIEPPIYFPEYASALKNDLKHYYKISNEEGVESAFHRAWDLFADDSWQAICDNFHDRIGSILLGKSDNNT